MVNSQAPNPNIENSYKGSVKHEPITQPDEEINEQIDSLLPRTIERVVSNTAEILEEKGIEASRLEAKILLGYVLGLSHLDLLLEGKRLVSSQDYLVYVELVRRRLKFEPIAYILKEKEFYGYEFMVGPGCLIPRPDTECVVEAALEFLSDSFPCLIGDICTGSGAIGLSILKERANVSLMATDISEAALGFAKINCKKLGLEKRVDFFQCDLFSGLPESVKFDLIVSNPPYITPKEIEFLAPDIKIFEPRIALSSEGRTGVEFYERILDSARKYLKINGYLVLEIGFGQRRKIEGVLGSNWKLVKVFNDLSGVERGIVLQSANPKS